MKRYLFLIIILFLVFQVSLKNLVSANPFVKDKRQQELKYLYEVNKSDEEYKRDKKILELNPSGYMTYDEYEAASEYKDKSKIDYVVPKVEAPSDFKYVPKPLYRIVKYNDPPGSPELSLGKNIYNTRQINAQGVASPDYSKLVYSAVYYYADSASVAADVFVIPLDQDGTNLNKILKANTSKRLQKPILSTDKLIDNYAAFRTLTPVDFNPDGSKILLKQKIGSSEDGIWETKPFVYDFTTETDYDLSAVRDAIVYFWKEYMNLNLDDVRWDIYPLGFDKNNSNSVVVQAFAFTGVKPVFLGTWSIDSKGSRSQVVSFDKNFIPQVSSNGYKVVKDGVEEYTSVKIQEKMDAIETKFLEKQRLRKEKAAIKEINDEYKWTKRELRDNYKDDARDLKKLRSLSGSTEGIELQEAYRKYLEDQNNKDIEKLQKRINKEQKKLDKIEQKINKLNSEFSHENQNSQEDGEDVQSQESASEEADQDSSFE